MNILNIITLYFGPLQTPPPISHHSHALDPPPYSLVREFTLHLNLRHILLCFVTFLVLFSIKKSYNKHENFSITHGSDPSTPPVSLLSHTRDRPLLFLRMSDMIFERSLAEYSSQRPLDL